MFKKIIGIIKARVRGEVTIERLKKKGLKVGENFYKENGCILDYSHCWLIEIGNNVTLAPRVHILAHDASTKSSLGYTKIGRVIIGNNVFVGASTIILPGVEIGDDVIIGAGSVVTKSIPSNSVACGNPAVIVCNKDEYIKRHFNNMNNRPVYSQEWTMKGGITSEMKSKMKKDLSEDIGYVV